MYVYICLGHVWVRQFSRYILADVFPPKHAGGIAYSVHTIYKWV